MKLIIFYWNNRDEEKHNSRYGISIYLLDHHPTQRRCPRCSNNRECEYLYNIIFRDILRLFLKLWSSRLLLGVLHIAHENMKLIFLLDFEFWSSTVLIYAAVLIIHLVAILVCRLSDCLCLWTFHLFRYPPVWLGIFFSVEILM